MPEGVCLYNDILNDESLVFNEFNDYRNHFLDFGLYENVCTLYKEKYNESLKRENLSSLKVEELVSNDIKEFEKKLVRLIYLLQKCNQSLLSNYEKRELDSGLFYIYGFDYSPEFIDKIKEYPINSFLYNLYNQHSLSFLKSDNPDFFTFFVYGNKNLVKKLMSFLNPIEKDILLSIFYKNHHPNIINLKFALEESGAKQLKGLSLDSNTKAFKVNNYNKLIELINEYKLKINELSFEDYEKLRGSCLEQ